MRWSRVMVAVSVECEAVNECIEVVKMRWRSMCVCGMSNVRSVRNGCGCMREVWDRASALFPAVGSAGPGFFWRW